ncbi:putative immunity protein [Hymenobacter sediminis]|uniref:putative immunity protein n=1 Tax=Hymenobacter sediminis TaxID=2218621 RepID=UPI0034DAC2F9
MLPLFEQAYPDDVRPRHALTTLRAWVQGQASMMDCRQAAFAAHGRQPPRRAAHQPAAVAAARAAGQAAAVAHMYTHAPHAAAYAAKALALAT